MGKRQLKNPVVQDVVMILTSFEMHVVAELRGSTIFWSDVMHSDDFPLLQLYLAVAVRALKAHGLLPLGDTGDTPPGSDTQKRSVKTWSKDHLLTPTRRAAQKLGRSVSGAFKD